MRKVCLALNLYENIAGIHLFIIIFFFIAFVIVRLLDSFKNYFPVIYLIG